MSNTAGQDPKDKTPGQDPNNQAGQDPKTGGQASPTVEELQAEVARLSADIKDLRKESARYRTEAKDLRDELDSAKKAGNGDLSKLEEKASALEKSLADANERAIVSEIKAQAAKAGFKNPDAAVKLIDRAKLVIDGSDVRNAGDVLAELAKSDPYLVGGDTGSGDAGAGASAKSGDGSFGETIRAAFGG